jgi:NADPH-dependent ferric siderophore reductase
MSVEEQRPIERIRYETRRRTLNVVAVAKLTPNMVSVSLSGDLEGFQTQGFDDHVKLFLPGGGADAAPIMRDFTPAHFDAARDTLQIEFALHQSGPASDWARVVQAGQRLEIGGPRGSMVIASTLANHVLIGDETALPAIKRRVRELPPQTKVIAVVEVSEAAEQQTLACPADLELHWAHRETSGAGALIAAVRRLSLPNQNTFAWAACEADVAKALRQVLITEKQIAKTHVKASGYWRRGASAIHEKFED